jgi:hypothetical protein
MCRDVKYRTVISIVAGGLLAFAGCDREPTSPSPEEASTTMAVELAKTQKENVTSVDQLYASVNDPANAGKTLILAAGTYLLSANDLSGNPRPNGGRLELQEDMSLSGVTDQPSAVVIDASALPAESFLSGFLTGPIRIGRGRNSVEWLTITGNAEAAGGIETDLAGTPATVIRVAHVVSRGSLRGIDVRNIRAGMAGRRITAEIVDNECSGIVEGIRLVNTMGANQAQIFAELRGNRVHDFQIGIIANNNRSSAAVVQVQSHGDRFEGNGLGALIAGGATGSGQANSNRTVFEAHGTAFINNTGPVDPEFGDAGGLLVLGGDTPGYSNGTFHNSVVVRLWGVRVFGNQNIDFQAFGSRSLADPPALGGTDNHAKIELHGVSKMIPIVAIDSSPEDPNHTNTVSIVRGGEEANDKHVKH